MALFINRNDPLIAHKNKFYVPSGNLNSWYFCRWFKFAPVVLNALKAASHGAVQRSTNTMYGSVVAIVSLTVPAVLILDEIAHADIILDLESFEMVLLALTLFLSYPHA